MFNGKKKYLKKFAAGSMMTMFIGQVIQLGMLFREEKRRQYWSAPFAYA
jgi:hypothetical protein